MGWGVGESDGDADLRASGAWVGVGGTGAVEPAGKTLMSAQFQNSCGNTSSRCVLACLLITGSKKALSRGWLESSQSALFMVA